MEADVFTCSICGESSTDLCVYCTKDACSNHLCERCRRCSDCCQCEVRAVAGASHPNGLEHAAPIVLAQTENDSSGEATSH